MLFVASFSTAFFLFLIVESSSLVALGASAPALRRDLEQYSRVSLTRIDTQSPPPLGTVERAGLGSQRQNSGAGGLAARGEGARGRSRGQNGDIVAGWRRQGEHRCASELPSLSVGGVVMVLVVVVVDVRTLAPASKLCIFRSLPRQQVGREHRREVKTLSAFQQDALTAKAPDDPFTPVHHAIAVRGCLFSIAPTSQPLPLLRLPFPQPSVLALDPRP